MLQTMYKNVCINVCIKIGLVIFLRKPLPISYACLSWLIPQLLRLKIIQVLKMCYILVRFSLFWFLNWHDAVNMPFNISCAITKARYLLWKAKPKRNRKKKSQNHKEDPNPQNRDPEPTAKTRKYTLKDSRFKLHQF